MMDMTGHALPNAILFTLKTPNGLKNIKIF